MNKKQIEKIRRRFIAASLLSLFLAMIFMGMFVNLSIIAVTGYGDDALCRYIIDNGGELPEPSDETMENPQYRSLSREDAFATRYFAVIYENGRVDERINGHIASVTEAEMDLLAAKAIDRQIPRGYMGRYYYCEDVLDDGRTIIVFIDSANKLELMSSVALATAAIAVFGAVITLIILIPFSKRVVKAEIENSERQQQFITNAGHELKTPLAVIRANTEVQELVGGQNEWTVSTMQQVERLDGLIKNLVTLSKSGELEDKGVLSRVNVVPAVSEAADAFSTVAMQNGVTLEKNLPDEVQLRADPEKIKQLVTILVDNAVKYCDEGGCVRVRLSKEKKGAKLYVSNDYSGGEGVDTSRFFERFYREDKSHNQDKGGYGIGLSIAEDICRRYRGSIKARWSDGVITFTCELRG